MDNRVITIFLVVIIGVLVGVGVVTKQGNDPLLQQILTQQAEMLSVQRSGQGSGGSGGNTAELAMKLGQLEARMIKIEKDMSETITGLRKMVLERVQPQPAARPAGPPPEDFDKVHDIPVDHSYVRGPKNAAITIVEFSDFQCPFCARFHKPILEVLKAYPNDVNLIVKNFPLSFHPNARPAAKAAFAAGEQGKYFEMVDKLLENGNALNQAAYERIAGELGLDVEKFKADLSGKDGVYEGYIQKDLQLGGKVQVRGTPTFYLQGKKTLARDFARFKSEIDKILAK